MLRGSVMPIQTVAGVSAIPVASTGNVKTAPIPINYSEFFGIWCKATSSSGTADVKVELEQCYFNSSTSTDWVTPDGYSAIFSQINDELVHVKGIVLAPMTFFRLSITGINANPADTIFEGQLFIQSHA